MGVRSLGDIDRRTAAARNLEAIIRLVGLRKNSSRYEGRNGEEAKDTKLADG